MSAVSPLATAPSVDLVARVTKLIALAGSANENEARNAAALACRLIRENGFAIVAAASAPRAPFDAEAWAAAYRPDPETERFMAEHARKEAEFLKLPPLERAKTWLANFKTTKAHSRNDIELAARELRTKRIGITDESVIVDLLVDHFAGGAFSRDEIAWVVRSCAPPRKR